MLCNMTKENGFRHIKLVWFSSRKLTIHETSESRITNLNIVFKRWTVRMQTILSLGINSTSSAYGGHYLGLPVRLEVTRLLFKLTVDDLQTYHSIYPFPTFFYHRQNLNYCLYAENLQKLLPWTRLWPRIKLKSNISKLTTKTKN
jgi:hypothetical protein